MATDKDIILQSLQRERDELHDKIMQVDRIMKRIKGLEYPVDDSGDKSGLLYVAPVAKAVAPAKPLSAVSNMKLVVLKAIDVIGHVCTLKDIQSEYNAITGNQYTVREAVRSLYNQGLLKMARDKSKSRASMWIKTDWLNNGQLADNHKPEGFDELYPADSLVFE